MSSFYGNGGGVSSNQVVSLVEGSLQRAKKHIVISKEEPSNQQIGDLWLVLENDDEEDNITITQ